MRYDKLVRDRIPEIIRENGATAVTRTLDRSELRLALVRKLREEVDEFVASDETEELVDILEVIYALASERGFAIEELNRLRDVKRAERGGFDGRIFLIESL